MVGYRYDRFFYLAGCVANRAIILQGNRCQGHWILTAINHTTGRYVFHTFERDSVLLCFLAYTKKPQRTSRQDGANAGGEMPI